MWGGQRAVKNTPGPAPLGNKGKRAEQREESGGICGPQVPGLCKFVREWTLS